MSIKKKYLVIVLYPNQSMCFKYSLFLGLIFLVLTTSISLYFLQFGAWPVVFFLFVDLIIILLAFKINYTKSQTYERIILSENLLIKKNLKQNKEKTIKIEPSWIRLKVSYYNNKGHLEIISKGKSQIIGSFLNFSELTKLAKTIKKALIKREKELTLYS